MKYLVISIIALSILNAQIVHAHGEDKMGPNRGFVRMPGPYHTELVPIAKNKLKVYLLDIEWKNPSVLRSKLEIIYNEKINATCEVKTNFYECVFPKAVNLKKQGHLKVIAEREGQSGAEVTYSLPLKLDKPTATPSKQDDKMDHSKHH